MKFLFLLFLLISNVFSLGERHNPIYTVNVGRSTGETTFDAFNRFRVANPYVLGDYVMKYDAEDQRFSKYYTSQASITHSTTEAVVKMKATTSGDVAIFQSNLFHRYQAGKAGEIVLSLAPMPAQTGVTKRWGGYFDDNNGLFFQLEGEEFSFCVRSDTSGNAVDTCYNSDDFNIPIKEAKDAVTDWKTGGYKATVFSIQFQWLGTGVVIASMLDKNGSCACLHKIKNPTANLVPYMRTATLPIRFEINGSAEATEENQMNVVCSAVNSSGGEDPPEDFFNYEHTNGEYTTTTANEEVVVALRLKEKFKNQDNRIIVLPTEVDFPISNGPANMRIYATRYAGVSGGTWTSIYPESGVEYSEDTTFISGKRLRFYGLEAQAEGGAVKSAVFSNKTVGFKKAIFHRTAFNDDSDIIVVTIQRTTATNAAVKPSISWGEIR